MTKSFDEWLETKGDRSQTWKLGAKCAYEAGQQSKQAEVDELQKRIDEALEAFDDGSFNYCRKILKGNTNDH